MRRFLATFCLISSLAAPASAFETNAEAAYVIDQTTGTVLLAKNADIPLPPGVNVQTDDALHGL